MSMIKCDGVECAVQIPQANGKQGLTALTNKKQEAFDQIRANMQSFRAGFAITARNIKIFFSEGSI
jgi:hypothetical protein